MLLECALWYNQKLILFVYLSYYMWCFIYRSTKKENCYLYLDKENDFSRVPAPLLVAFGQPKWVMKILLTSRHVWAAAPASVIRDRIQYEGYFLQMLSETDFTFDKRKKWN